MPRNGSGTYAPPAGQPVVGGTTIDSAVFNALVADLGTEFTRSVSTDGQSPMGANLPMGGFKITGMAAGTLATDAARVDQLGGPASTLRTDLAANSGSSLVGFIQSGVGSVDRTTQDKQRDIRQVMDFYIAAEANASAMFNRASVNAGVGGSIVVPGQAFVLGDEVAILDYQTWIFEGTRLTHTDDTKTMLRANTKVGWSILGRLHMTGLLVSASSSAEIGLYITSGQRYRVEGVTCSAFKGRGIYLDGSGVGVGGLRGDRGQFTDCSTHQCTVGLEIGAGAGGEYNTWANFTASGNTQGMKIDAGNNTFIGGNCVDNTDGILLTASGGNHAHGMFVGMNINHNTNSNIHALNVTNGHTFLGCHAYGNASTSQGNIWFENSKGICFMNGVIDAWIYNDTGASSGMNRVSGNYFPTGTTNTALQSNNAGLHQLQVMDNFDSTGMSSLNDAAPVYVNALRASSTQGLASGTTAAVIWNSEVIDNRKAHDTTTGLFTAPVAGTYRCTASITVTGTTVTSGYGQLRVNGALQEYGAIGLATAATGVIVIAGDVVVTAGQTIDFAVNVVGTGSLAVAITSSRMSIALIR